MSPIMVGGDGSVIWKVHAEKVKSTKTSSLGRVHDQEGVDETSGKGFFTVTIKLPSNGGSRADFIDQLERFIANPESELIVRLPIEDMAYLKAKRSKLKDGVYDQVKVDWPK